MQWIEIVQNAGTPYEQRVRIQESMTTETLQDFLDELVTPALLALGFRLDGIEPMDYEYKLTEKALPEKSD